MAPLYEQVILLSSGGSLVRVSVLHIMIHEHEYFELAVEAPLTGTLTYAANEIKAEIKGPASVDEDTATSKPVPRTQLVRGASVMVPLGRRSQVRAVIIKKSNDEDLLGSTTSSKPASNQTASNKTALDQAVSSKLASSNAASSEAAPSKVTSSKTDASTAEPKKYEIKAIAQVNEQRPLLSELYLQWLEWLAHYYVYPLGLVLRLAFPPLDKKQSPKKKQIEPPVTRSAVHRRPRGSSQASPAAPVSWRWSSRPSHAGRNATASMAVPISRNRRRKPTKARAHLIRPSMDGRSCHGVQLNSTQRRCVDEILKPDGFRVHLLQGVTGSGKTEVYLNLFEHYLQQGQQGLMLTPEIALTPQLVKQFKNRFGDQVAVMHSQLTPREKTNQWWDMVEGRRQILIGVRSALFCPLPRLGLIVIDEEHEASFKQDTKFKYHARDSAIVLAQKQGIPIVLGSATPSLESLHNAQRGRYLWHKMPHRVGNSKLPSVEVVDLSTSPADETASRSLGGSAGRPFWMSEVLHQHMQQCLQRREQVALFLNRRGMARQQLCQRCGEAVECPNCDISLTLHGKKYLVCHYCEYSKILQKTCGSCGSDKMITLGLGTEAVERDVKTLFPEARVMRADRDEITNRKQLESLIYKMEQHELDILVGTQMIAKGLDFEKLSLAGLVLADTSFNLPDFRAPERAFQLMVQMSGRAGRKRRGHVVIQAYNPVHPSVECAKQHDYFAFSKQELQGRQELNYPPFGRLCLLSLEGKKEARTQQVADRLKEKISALQRHWPKLSVLGPAPAPIFKLCNKYRYHILLKAPSGLSAFCHIIQDEYTKMAARSTRLHINIDPQS